MVWYLRYPEVFGENMKLFNRINDYHEDQIAESYQQSQLQRISFKDMVLWKIEKF